MNKTYPQQPKIKIAIASDHAGWVLKNNIKNWLVSLNYQVYDVGCQNDLTRVDFVPFAQKVARLVSNRKVNYGILCCFSGVGMTIASNRFANVRAVRINATDVNVLKLARQHNDVNLLALGSHFVTFAQSKQLLHKFLHTSFCDIERYSRRKQLLDQNLSVSCFCKK